MEAADKGFFKDKTHPRPGPLHSILSMARNTQLPLSEVVSRFFPQHDAVADLLPLFAKKYAERKRETGEDAKEHEPPAHLGVVGCRRRRRFSHGRCRRLGRSEFILLPGDALRGLGPAINTERTRDRCRVDCVVPKVVQAITIQRIHRIGLRRKGTLPTDRCL